MSSEQEQTGAEGVRLQKVLARAGVASRRVAENLIAEGRVSVDGEVVAGQGRRVDPETAVIHVDGRRVVVGSESTYLALNKPRGVHSTMSDDRGRRCVGDYVRGRGQGLFHIGRLDADTEGLLLLTNDGDLANRLMHPSYEVGKTYLAEVRGRVARGLGQRLRAGVTLSDGEVRVDRFRIVDAAAEKSLVELVLHSGRNRVVRRLMDEVGHPVRKLVRTAVAEVRLGEARPGTVRTLTREEIASLYAAAEHRL
jgi:23S rRNA pseudouridine2605 synthase